MPNQRTVRYNLDDVNGKIGPILGQPTPIASLTGYGEDGGIEFSVEANVQEVTVGADGHVSVSVNNNQLVTATVTVMEGSVVVPQLLALLRRQQALLQLEPLPFFMVDPHSGDEIHEEIAIFQNVPGPTKNATSGERAFNIALPHARSDIILGGALTQLI